MRDPVGKVLAICGVLVLALSITPTGGGIDPDAGWWVTQWTWIQRTRRQGPQATPITINPFLLYLGVVLSIAGIALRPSGASTPDGTTPRQVEPSMNIFVGNFPFTTTEDDLRHLFAPYGRVAHVHLITEHHTGRPRGFGFVEMPDTTEAHAAIEALHGRELGGRTLTVSDARPRRPRG